MAAVKTFEELAIVQRTRSLSKQTLELIFCAIKGLAAELFRLC